MIEHAIIEHVFIKKHKSHNLKWLFFRSNYISYEFQSLKYWKKEFDSLENIFHWDLKKKQ